MAISPTSDAGTSPAKDKATTPQGHRRFPRRTLVIALAVAALLVIGLAVGLGVGLTQAHHDSTNSSALPSALPTPTIPTGNTSVWQPAVNSSWQIVLDNSIKLNTDATSLDPDVDIIDIDLFTNAQSTMDTLHKLGKRVICYFSAGSYEPYRPDSSQFKPSDLGKTLDGWPDERWLNINSTNVRRIMANRIALAGRKGCDAIDPDNVDGYDNDNGLGLTASDSIDYMQYLATHASANGLAIGLKNAAEIVTNVASIVQFSVNEQCVEYQECGEFAPLIQAHKPVFHIEYPQRSSSGVVPSNVAAEYCASTGNAAGSAGFSTLLKDMALDGWVQFCNGSTADTPMIMS